MAILNQTQLVAASNATYIDNTSGSITPLTVRTFNDSFISSSIVASVTSSMSVASASYAATASIALNFNPSATASYALSAGNADNATNADQATFANTAGSANSAITASFALNFNPAATASYANFAATASVLLGFVDSASFATFALTASSAGQFNVRTALTASGLRYPTADGTVEQFLSTNGAGTLSFANVRTLYQAIRNREAVAITKGAPLFVSGSTGDNADVYLADAANPLRMPATLIAGDTTLASGATGRGIILGHIEGVDTTGYPAGTLVYVAGGGGWTSTAPTGSAQVQPLGVVTRTGVNGMGIVLTVPPNSLPNIASGNTWVGNANGVPTAVATSSLSVATASYVQNAVSASYASNADLLDNLNFTAFVLTSSFTPFSSSVSSRLTAAPTLTGNNTFTGTNNFNVVSASFINAQSASIDYLSVVYQTSSIVYSSGSNQFGDAANDTQTLFGRVDVRTGPLTVTGSVNSLGGFTGSLLGNAQTATTATSATTAATASSVSTLNQAVTIVGTGTRLTITGSTAGTAATFSDRSMNVIAYDSQGVDVSSQLFSSDTGIAGQYIGAIKSDFSVDVEHAIIATTNSITLNDWDNNSATYVPYLSIAPNTGNNPAPQFRRGLGITGSVNGNVVSASIASNTSSIDFSLGNFYTSLVSGSTRFNITNPKPGQTVNLLLTTAGVATASFSSNVRQVSGSVYTPTSGSGRNDILTFISWDGTSVYLANVKNLI